MADKNVIPGQNRYLAIRFFILRRDGFTCRYCGASPIDDPTVRLQIDHIEPKSKGGLNVHENYITACFNCNVGKKDIILSKHETAKLLSRKAVNNDCPPDNIRPKKVRHDKMAAIEAHERFLANDTHVGTGGLQPPKRKVRKAKGSTEPMRIDFFPPLPDNILDSRKITFTAGGITYDLVNLRPA